jgi:hypothetical protein
MSELVELKCKAFDTSRKLKELQHEFEKTNVTLQNLLKEIDLKEKPQQPEEKK